MNDCITTIKQLESLYDAPHKPSIAKELPQLNEGYKKFIEASPYVSVATSGPDGLDCSPRGDAPGFVTVLDDNTLALPDRRGNNRLDTLRNIVSNPAIAMLFMIPGVNETIRVNGRALISTNSDLLNTFDVGGKKPVTAIVVTVHQVYFQCARALKRSKLWDHTLHIDPASLPSAGSLIQSAISDFDAQAYDQALQKRQDETLW